MAFNFQTRVEGYVGTSVESGALSNWLTQGARRLVDILPFNRIVQYAEGFPIPESGASISFYRLTEVVKDGLTCIQAPAGYEARLVQPGSLHFATANNPRYVVKNNMAYIYPSSGGGTGYGIRYPELVKMSDDTIPTLPPGCDELVVVYAAIQALVAKLTTEVEGIVAPSISSYTMPDAPIQAISVVPSTPSITTVTYTEGDIPTLVEVPLSGLSAPTAPTFTDTASIAFLLPELSISDEFTTLASYLDLDKDIELANAKMQNIQVRLAEYQSLVAGQSAAVDGELRRLQASVTAFDGQVRAFAGEVDLYRANIQKTVEEARLAHEKVMKSSDMELQSHLAKSRGDMEAIAANNRSVVDLYQAEVQAYVASFQGYAAAVQAYSAEVGAVIAQIRSDIDVYQAGLAGALRRQELIMSQIAVLNRVYRDGLQMLIGGVPVDDKTSS